MNEVLARCLDAVKNFFNIDNFQIGQPVVLNDLYLTIAGIEGVQSVLSVNITNKYRFKDGLDYNPYLYDVNAATINGILYASADPSIFEIRRPEVDITGGAIQ